MNSRDYVLNSKSALSAVFEKLGSIPEKIVIIVDDDNRVLGTITDGDIRRTLTKKTGDLSSLTPSEIMNTEFIFDWDDDLVSNKNAFSSAVKIIPVIDRDRILKHVRREEVVEFMIGDTKISDQSPAYVIAEIGNNHNGSLALAYELIERAKYTGANAAKFQMRQLSNTYIETARDAIDEDLGSQYTLDLLKKFQLSNDDLFKCFDYCKSIGIEPLCTPWDTSSVQLLSTYGLAAYKVASADLTNYELLNALAQTNKPIILSTGMSSEPQIKYAVDLIDGLINDYALLHCNSAYPAPFKDINLKYMNKLRQISQTGIVGYSGHERGIEVAIAAVALGAKIVEKHFTLDKGMEGSDHKVSLLPSEFKSMVTSIRNIESALIYSETRIVSQGEMLNKETLGKSVVASKDIAIGSVISAEDLTLKSPGKGLSPDKVKNLIGKKTIRNMSKDDFFFPSDVEQKINKFSRYNFNRNFGIPVRYHDLNDLYGKSNFDFLEFHLSYGDIGLNLNKIINKCFDNLSFHVHAPELFEEDHVLDLASRNKEYRAKSIENLNRIVDETSRIRKFFPNTAKSFIIFNAGGFSENEFVTDSFRNESYNLIEESLATFKNLDHCELIIQTMPPYPWHFGGQRYHNNFVNHSEIKAFCEKTGFNICFDLSHSYLACNHYDVSLDEFIKTTKDYIKYMHVVDAKNLDGEGLQIGDGEIDFNHFTKVLNKLKIEAGFIPEIWQGHKDGGRGFIEALDILQRSGL